jgi:flagellar biosynthesis protein FlhF
MTTKTFTAKNMDDALRMVRQQLGPDASVVQSREVSTSGVLRWIYPNRRVEVTAARQPPVVRPTPPRKRRKSSGRQVERQTSNSVTLPAEDDQHDVNFAIDDAESCAVTDKSISPEHEDLRQKLIDLRSVMQKVQNGPVRLDPASLSAALADLAKRLCIAEVPDALAVDLIEAVRDTVPEAQHDNHRVLFQRLVEIVAEDLKTTGGISSVAGQRRTVAVVGPAGVGKTTMLAKLAADHQLRQRRSVALVTCDNFRIAAVDQLQTYADIIGVPMVAVATPRDMRTAIQQLSNHDLVLVDTPGRSPGDDVKLQEVKSLLNDAEPDEVHLVQSCSSAPSHLRRCLEKFAMIGLTGVILTKLDEAITTGHLLPIMKQTHLPISYISDGQVVPDDMHVAQPLDLAERFLTAI